MKMDPITMVVNMEYKAIFGPKHGSSLLSSLKNSFPVSKLSCLPLTSFPINKPSRFVRLNATTTPSRDDQESNRKFRILLPSPWTHYFHSLSVDVSEMDALRKEIDHVLKPKVKNALMSSQGIDSTKNKILLIYLLVSLLLAHHFEDEIHETLEECFENIDELMDGEEDLYTVSIIFWVFRRYGHHISSDVFKRFKKNNGDFKESLIGDAKGMLSLYEASHLRTTKDYILDEALSFTSIHLESLAASGTCLPHLSIRIRSAFYQPQNWNMDMLVPLEYISYYEQEKDHDEMLLKFSKLSLKLLQLQYLEELKIVTKWYKELDLASKLPPYFRDRIVENYFFVKAVFFEPHLSRARMLLTQVFTALVIVDDTFDRYASLPEAECLANSLERWAPDHAMDKQPDYLKFALNSIFDIFKEFERELNPEGRSYSVDATKEEVKKVAKANIELLKWVHAGHVPNFEEYMEVGEVEVTSSLCMVAILMSMLATREDFDWLKSRPKLVKCFCVKGRLMNDMTGFEDDMNRGYVTNAVNCYMKQYGVTKKEAFKELNKILEENDKVINEEILTTNCVSRYVLKAIMDFARMNAVTYNGIDGFTNPQVKIKEFMISMYVDLIHL